MAPSDPRAQLDAIFARLRFRETAARREAQERIVVAARQAVREIWPQPGPAHPYATGRSARAALVRKDGQHIVVVSWPASIPYAKFTNEGYTRAGRATARSYRQRGSLTYLEQVGQRVAGEAAKLTAEILLRRLRGG